MCSLIFLSLDIVNKEDQLSSNLPQHPPPPAAGSKLGVDWRYRRPHIPPHKPSSCHCQRRHHHHPQYHQQHHCRHHHQHRRHDDHVHHSHLCLAYPHPHMCCLEGGFCSRRSHSIYPGNDAQHWRCTVKMHSNEAALQRCIMLQHGDAQLHT